jgi:hypothetical protein
LYGTLHYPSDILGSINSSTIVYRYFRVNDDTNTLLGRVTFPIQEAPTSYFQNDGAGNVWISQASQVGQPQVIGQPNLYLTVLAGQDKAFKEFHFKAIKCFKAIQMLLPLEN